MGVWGDPGTTPRRKGRERRARPLTTIRFEKVSIVVEEPKLDPAVEADIRRKIAAGINRMVESVFYGLRRR